MYRKIDRFPAISWRTEPFRRRAKGAAAAAPFLIAGTVMLYNVLANNMRSWALAAAGIISGVTVIHALDHISYPGAEHTKKLIEK